MALRGRRAQEVDKLTEKYSRFKHSWEGFGSLLNRFDELSAENPAEVNEHFQKISAGLSDLSSHLSGLRPFFKQKDKASEYASVRRKFNEKKLDLRELKKKFSDHALKEMLLARIKSNHFEYEHDSAIALGMLLSN